MKIIRKIKNLSTSILISLLFNLQWTVPAWIFLGLHFWLDIPIWWFVGSMTLWVLIISIRTIFFSSLTSAGNYVDPPRENKNPYSSSGYKPTKK